MLIAQAFAEYSLLATLAEGMYRLRIQVEAMLGPAGITWLGIAVAAVVVLVLIRR